MENNTIIKDLTTGSILRHVVDFALPTMLSNAMTICYNMVDMVIVGQFIGSPGITAVSNGADLLYLFNSISTGLTAAIHVLISRIVGSKDYSKLQKMIGTSIAVMTIIPILLSSVGLLLIKDIMIWLNTPEEAFVYSSGYLTVCLIGLPLSFLYNTISSILRGLGDSKKPMIFIIIASLLNIMLDYLFVGPMNMSVKGAAIATVISQALSFGLAFVYLYRKKAEIHFDFKLRRFVPRKEALTPLVTLGFPLILQYGIVDFSRVFIASYINSYGVIMVALTGIGQRITNFTSIVSAALNTASTTIIAQNYGAKKWSRIPKTLFLCVGISLCFAAILSTIIVLFPKSVFGIFTSEADVLKATDSYVVIVVLMVIGMAVRQPMFSLFHALGKGKLNVTASLIDGVGCKILLSVFLGKVLNLGIMGFWSATVIGGFVGFFISSGYYLFSFRPMVKNEMNKN